MHRYWKAIFKQIFEVIIKPNPKIALLQFLLEDTAVPTAKRRFLHMALMAGNTIILVAWKSKTPPVFDQWVKETIKVGSYVT